MQGSPKKEGNIAAYCTSTFVYSSIQFDVSSDCKIYICLQYIQFLDFMPKALTLNN